VVLRAEQRATLAEFAGHGFKYGGSSSQINMQQMKLKQIEKSDLEAEEEAEQLAVRTFFTRMFVEKCMTVI
jgi:ATP-binding cassette subfamily F protein 3